MHQVVEFVGNHPFLFLALAVILGALIWSFVSDLGGSQVSCQDLTRMVNRDDALVLDIRDAAEFDQGHIVNAINIPAARLGERIGELGKQRDKPIIVCCALGNQSAGACRQLAKAGFTKVFRLRGGIAAWRNESLPLARGTKRNA